MENDELLLYRRWLACGLKQEKKQETEFVQESFAEGLQRSAAYQSDATVNGKSQPIVATRQSTKKCKATVIPGTRLYIGDLVRVFGEYWICVEMYVDEYGMWYGELWMCNQIFCYQDHDLNIIRKYAIMDDGSYSSGNEKPIQVTDNGFKCYISLDDESRALYVDKRLAISTIYDSKGKEILEVGQIKWIDMKNKNFGEGSHLMLFGIKDDAFNAEKDNIEELICDYIVPPEVPSNDNTDTITPDDSAEEPIEPEVPSVVGKLSIDGNTTLRLGVSRTYTVQAILDENSADTDIPSVEWCIAPEGLGITIQKVSETSCKVTVPEKDNLIGETFKLICESIDGTYDKGILEVEVM